MDGRGLEQSALSPTKTPILGNTRAKSGAVKDDFRRTYPDYAEQIGRSDLPEPMKGDLIKLLAKSE